MGLVSRARIIIDTGPLVAFVREAEAAHPWVAARFAELPAPFLTCEAVLTETFFLLSRGQDGPRRFFQLLDSGLLEVNFDIFKERQTLDKLVRKYRDLRMSLADACIVRMSEIFAGATVFTLDAHFRIYRKNGRQPIPVIMP